MVNRKIKLLLGFFFTGLGIIGAILPVMPSTCFFIFAAYYFGQSSERMENWLLNHPRVGPTIINWRKYKAIPRLGKIMACAGMSLSAVLMILSAAPFWVKIGCLVILALSAAYVLTRPTLKNYNSANSVNTELN